MEIVRQQREGFLELCFEGRLDAYWAQHLSASVDEVMREGTHHLRLNLSRTSYISSAGIGVLVKMYKEFAAIDGSFAVAEPSRQVKHILDMVGLAQMLSGAQAAGAAGAKPSVPPPEIQRTETGGAVFEIHSCSPGAELTGYILGDPGRLATAAFAVDDCRSVSLSENRLALGLGAFGETFANCRERFGEFLAVAGAGACQPTDGANYPDHMLSSGAFVPQLSALYSLYCEGDFQNLVRFESASGKDPVPLSLIVDSCIGTIQSESAGIVIVAESAGLLGAVLKRSPASNGESARLFAYPEIRRWLSFSPERCYPHALVLIVGVASRSAPEGLRPFLRPMSKGSNLAGHFHAAAFGYRPLQKGRVELRTAVRGLFDAGGLEGVLHLLSDDRSITGAGESELLRGACWIGPVRQFVREGERP
jgi:anti-anti-sigma factor